MAHRFGGFDFNTGAYGIIAQSTYNAAPRRTMQLALSEGGAYVASLPHGARVDHFEIEIHSTSPAALEADIDALKAAFSKPWQRLEAGYSYSRYRMATLAGEPTVAYQGYNTAVASVDFMSASPYVIDPAPRSHMAPAPTVAALPGTPQRYQYRTDLVSPGTGRTPLHAAITARLTSPVIQLASIENLDTGGGIGFLEVLSPTSGIVAIPDRGVRFVDYIGYAAWWPLWDAGLDGFVRDLSGNDNSLRAHLNANPSFDIDTAGWGVVNATITRITSDYYSSPASARVQVTAINTSNTYTTQTANLPAGPTAGYIYKVRGRIKGEGATIGRTVRLQLTESGGASAAVVIATQDKALTAAWQEFTAQAAIVQNDRTQLAISALMLGNNAVGESFLVDDLYIEPAGVTFGVDGSDSMPDGARLSPIGIRFGGNSAYRVDAYDGPVNTNLGVNADFSVAAWVIPEAMSTYAFIGRSTGGADGWGMGITTTDGLTAWPIARIGATYLDDSFALVRPGIGVPLFMALTHDTYGQVTTLWAGTREREPVIVARATGVVYTPGGIFSIGAPLWPTAAGRFPFNGVVLDAGIAIGPAHVWSAGQVRDIWRYGCCAANARAASVDGDMPALRKALVGTTSPIAIRAESGAGTPQIAAAIAYLPHYE